MTEVWRPVAGYEGIYSVSDHGAIRSESRSFRCPSRGVIYMPQRILRAGIGSSGYLQVCLQRNGVRRTARVHVVVAEAFIGPRPAGLQVAHRDGKKSNNAAGNLRYATRSENSNDSRQHGTLRAKLTREQASAIKAMAGPHSVAAKAYGVSVSAVSKIRLGQLWAHMENA